MILCPNCDALNIDGADDCEQCGQPLAESHLSPPTNNVERCLLNDRVSVLGPKPAITVAPATPIGDVLRLMVEHRIGCVIVAEGNRPVGIFSERDALRKLNTAAVELARQPVSEFMTSNPQTLLADAKIAFAVQRMDLGSYRHLPIVDKQGDLVGIISARDIVRYLTDKMTAP